jgi:putative ABC transport system permease protein
MIHQTLRSLGRNPGFAVVAVLTLSVGIGANTAMFSLVNGILLKPLTYRDPGRLATISMAIPSLGHLYPAIPVSAYYLTEWRKQARTVEELALLRSNYMNLSGQGDSERLNTVAVSSSFFHMIGASSQLGRTFLPNEDQSGNERVAILSDGLWRRRFGGNRSVLGSSIQLNGNSYQVIGIMPSEFPFPQGDEVHRLVRMPDQTDLWLPLTVRPEETQRMVNHNYAAIARLKPGIPFHTAEAELNEILRHLSGIPKNFEIHARLTPLQTDMVARVRQGLIVLMAAIGAVLLIVCVNITNLLLTRGTSRRRELAVRTALGSSRLRLCITLLGESVVLAGLGSAGGILLAFWLLDAVRVHLPVGLPRIDEVAVDLPTLLFALVVTLLCAVLCGLAPAWRLSGADPAEALKDGGHGSTVSRGMGRLRAGLISCEVGMCVVLLVGAGLLLTSFFHIAAIDQGFKAGNVFVAEADLSGPRYKDPQVRLAFFREVLSRAAALPGVPIGGGRHEIASYGSDRNHGYRSRRRFNADEECSSGRVSDGDAQLFRHHEHSRTSWPRVRRSCRRSEGRANQRTHRRTHLAGAGSDRAAVQLV